MSEFNAVSSNSIDNNDEAIHKNFLYKTKSITDNETGTTLLKVLESSLSE